MAKVLLPVDDSISESPNQHTKRTLKYIPFSSFVNITFWYKFIDLKLNEDKSKEVTRSIWGYYSYTQKSAIILVDCTSFNSVYEVQSLRAVCHGYHINTNTEEKFNDLNKSELITEYGEKLLESMKNGNAVEDPSKLIYFLVLSYADLKKYKFKYWFAFPAMLDYLYYYPVPICLGHYMNPLHADQLQKRHQELPVNQKSFFVFKIKGEDASVFTLKEFISDPEKFPPAMTFIAYLDPTKPDDNPGWPMRNLLTLLRIQCADIFKKSFNVVSLRGKYKNWIDKSNVYIIQESEQVDSDKQNKFIGWEKLGGKKFLPREIDLRDTMDPVKKSNEALNLNLKLMKWRLQPDLDLDIIKNTSCLILGAGTLGCSVARNLLGWGVVKFTFVDNKNLSLSNPTRQSLYTYKQADQLKPVEKAKAAASSLKLIHPAVSAEGVALHIPFPGFSIAELKEIQTLHDLIKSHDVVFMLTDTRESRWLPTLFSAVEKKIAITIGLGHDSYVVTRHGISNGKNATKLGCYFCNDIILPADSLRNRDLDQRCTLSRPGLSSIASAYGVELLMALLQHPEKGEVSSDGNSCLGKIPHSIRGFIADHEYMFPSTPAFDRCVACSDIVINEYLREGYEFLFKVFKDEKYLNEVISLDQYLSVNDDFDFPESDIEEDK